MTKKISRRQFVGVGLALGGALMFPSPGRIVRGANDQVGLGGIGCGWRGGQLLDSFRKISGLSIVALADPDSANLADNQKKSPSAQGYEDLRKLIDDPKVDAVYIATCNHWHCLAAIWAMQAGKDVYVEKPLSHTPWEGEQVVKAARKYKRICQVGTQQRSDPMQAKIKEFLHQEKGLGAILSASVNRYGVRESIGKRETPLSVPSTLQYDLWLGPAEDRPLFRDKLHYDWHWDWNTGSGEMGNWGVHVMDDMKNIVLLDKMLLPKRIMGGGARVVYQDAGETPNVHFAYFDTGIIPVVMGLSNIPEKTGSRSAGRCFGPGSGYVAYCEGGTLQGQRGKAVAVDNEGKVIKEFVGDSGAKHQQNFIDAVRAGDSAMLNAEVALGNASTDWCNLANIAVRCGQPFTQTAADQLNGKTKGRWEELMANTAELLRGNNLTLENSPFHLSPLLELEADRCAFVGENATTANTFLKRQYREGFVVSEIK